jgi:hypothetical protein
LRSWSVIIPRPFYVDNILTSLKQAVSSTFGELQAVDQALKERQEEGSEHESDAREALKSVVQDMLDVSKVGFNLLLWL